MDVVVNVIIIEKEEDLQDVLYVTKLITYVLKVHLKTKLTLYCVLNVEWVITL